MTVPVSHQFNLIREEVPDHDIIKKLKTLQEALAPFHLKFILDLSFSAPQGYYDGFYFHIFLDKNEPVLSGGQYEDNGFGIALNLSEGGLI
jgi:histidyl-tRNA synthetase